MKIMSLTVSNSKEVAEYNFTEKNHIFSEKNSHGKTTLIRFLIYALGYDVPITEQIHSGRYDVTLNLSINGHDIKIVRRGRSYTVFDKDIQVTYSVEKDNLFVLSKLYGNSNVNILKNLLGCHYIDQESGWVVFNRGTVISGQDLNVDQLVYGLSYVDESLFIKIKKITEEIKNYKSLISLYHEQEKLEDYLDQNDITSDEMKAVQKQLDSLIFEQQRHKKLRKSLGESLKQNDMLWEYIDSLKMTLVLEDGTRVKITKDNIEGMPESDDFLNASIFEKDVIISAFENQIVELKSKLNEFFCSLDVTKQFKVDGGKKSFHIDIEEVQNNRKLLETQKRNLEEILERELEKSDYQNELNQCLCSFAEKLGVKDLLNKKGIFARDFTKNTGTNKQKLVLSYRLTLLKIVSNYLGIKLPIIIDSLNRETDKENLDNIRNFISEEFPDHQVILSTINKMPPDYGQIKVEGGFFQKKEPKRTLKDFESTL